MPLFIAAATFLTVMLTVYGLLYRRIEQNDVLTRLETIRSGRPQREELPDPTAAFGARVLKPMTEAFGRRLGGLLPSSIAEKLERMLPQAGITIGANQLIVGIVVFATAVPLVFALMLFLSGAPAKNVLLTWGVLTFIGGYGPRFWLGMRIKRRQKEIRKSLPDAFDLITASVEAGLGVDAAFSRVIEKVHGPFAEELIRTMREITMGRSRRDAFMDMAERTGVEELRSLVNAIVQAEMMGISIGTVIRVQTGVMRTKRRQRAEEQAMKAPVKMVFPLVFFIFPAIMVVIGGPAAIQIRDGL
ncbi:MAG: type II secretion system F family protein [Tepidiformaceae bacterium]